MIELLLAALWITYTAVLILNYINHRKISRLEKKQQEQIKTISAQLRFMQLSEADKKKLGHQWLSHCAATGIKIPYSQYVTDQLKEVPSE